MKFGLFLALALLACRPTPPPTDTSLGVMATPAVNQRVPLFHAAKYTAPGDSLDYSLFCTTNVRAASYRWNTTATGAGWTGMLVNAPALTCGPAMSFKPINIAGWDTTTFRACVTGLRGTDTTRTPGCVSWFVRRGLGSMQPPSVDSSRIITAMYVFPESTSVNVLASKQFCDYWQSLDGMIRMQNGQEAIVDCQSYYDMLPAGIRPPGYTTAIEFKPFTHERWRDDIKVAHGPLPIEGRYKIARMMFASR